MWSSASTGPGVFMWATAWWRPRLPRQIPASSALGGDTESRPGSARPAKWRRARGADIFTDLRHPHRARHAVPLPRRQLPPRLIPSRAPRARHRLETFDATIRCRNVKTSGSSASTVTWTQWW